MPKNREGARKIRLTEKRMAELGFAITVDDVLHEKFRRMWEEFRAEQDRFARTKRVCAVVRREGRNKYVAMQILEVQHGQDGMRLIVR